MTYRAREYLRAQLALDLLVGKKNINSLNRCELDILGTEAHAVAKKANRAQLEYAQSVLDIASRNLRDAGLRALEDNDSAPTRL